MNKLEVDEIQIFPVRPQNGLVAFASFVANSFYVGNVAIYTSFSTSDGYRLVYPTKTLPNGKTINCVYPINRDAGAAVQEAVVREFNRLAEKVVEKDEKINLGS